MVSNFVVSFASGGCVGCAVDLALFPLDTIKTRVQARSPMQWSNMYHGLSWTMAASFPCAATFWSTYHSAKWALSRWDLASSPALIHFLSACTGSLCTLIVRNPFEVVKQQLQTRPHETAWSVPARIVKTQGVSGLYAGLYALVSREIPFDATQMLLYEYLKGKDYGGQDLPLASHMKNGAIAGGVAAFVTTPVDVVKTRIMTDGGRGVYTSFFPTLASVAREAGVRSLWAGWHVRVAFTTIGGVMFFGAFECVHKLLISS